MDKKVIWEHCLSHLEEKIGKSRNHLNALKESSANDTKSSAGDKFETSREMMQQEITKAESHLSQLVGQHQLLQNLSGDRIFQKVELGAYVVTDKGSFLISAPIGKIKMEDGFFYGISTESPMGAALLDLKFGDSAEVNQRKIKILEIY